MTTTTVTRWILEISLILLLTNSSLLHLDSMVYILSPIAGPRMLHRLGCQDELSPSDRLSLRIGINMASSSTNPTTNKLITYTTIEADVAQTTRKTVVVTK